MEAAIQNLLATATDEFDRECENREFKFGKMAQSDIEAVADDIKSTFANAGANIDWHTDSDDNIVFTYEGQ